MHLTVIHPFGKYKRGDKINDLAQMDLALKGENAHHLIRTADVPKTESEVQTKAPQE
jgi:hypothetical protein